MFDMIVRTIMVIISAVTLYPFIYVISMSISSPMSVLNQEVFLFPKGFSIKSYGLLFENKEIWQSYYNTLWYTAVGTSVNMVMTVLAAYPLSRKSFCGRNSLTFFITFTMFFSGGLIPLYITINKLGLYDTRWAMILPGAVSAFNIIIARTYFQGIPDSLYESAYIDGANDIRILRSIILPLSKPIISVLAMFYAVGHWNSFFPATLYLPSKELQPIQIFLRKILIMENGEMAGDMSIGIERSQIIEQLKYSSIVITILPIILIYPFLQKHFIKGVMVGAIKG